jgi:replicative DNA helicase
MIESIVIYILLNKIYYNKYYKYIKIQNKELIKLYYCIKSLHDKSNKDLYTVDELEIEFLTNYPFLKDVEKEIYTAIFRKLREVVLDEDRIQDYLEKQREAVLARQVAELALEVTEGTKSFSDILDHVSRIDVERPIVDDITFVSDDLELLYDQQIAAPGLRWRLDCLNKSLGSLRKGDFGFIFARPETGKTTFLASEVTHMATQTDRPILWFNNEEQGEKVMLRCIQSSLGVTQPELYADLARNKSKFYALTKKNLKIYDSASIHKHDVERICETVKPALIIFDQIDKVKGFDGERTDLALGSLYQWARELAKVYCPVIGVCQADGTGEGVKYLTMGHVANAKTAKQAEADWIVGIGKSNNEGEDYTRYFNISKNKLTGDNDTLPDMRHGQMYTIIKPQIGRYEDGLY